jgi:ABC-2 type transport system ATP-binding protein
MGIMLQQGGIYPGIRAGEAAALFCAHYGHRRRSDELLSMVGLTERARSTWRQLSGGEQQRLSLALALVGRPEVAFLDEPTAGVDVAGKQLIRSRILDLRAEGVAVVLTTHDLEEAEALADRIVIVDAGHVVVEGSPDELLSSSPTDHFDFRAGAGLDVGSLGTALGATVSEPSPGAYRVHAAPTPAGVAALATWLADRDELIGDLRAGRQRLDELFLRLTGEESPADLRTGRDARRTAAAP